VNLAAQAPAWLALILAILLIAAAAQDCVQLKISNIIVGLVLLGAIAAALIVGPEIALWQNLAILAGLIAIGMPLFATGKLGGGDVKLLAVTGAWFNLAAMPRMLIAVFIAGGVLALLILVLRAFRWSEGARNRIVLLRPHGGIPYGVAIAAGALVTMVLARG
jgi:prepilin peptidase CpaA